jgi:chitinase
VKTVFTRSCGRIAVLALASVAFGQRVGNQSQVQPRQIIGYFNEGTAESGEYTIKNIVTSGAAHLLTQLNYAFGRVAGNRCAVMNADVAVRHSYSADKSVDGSTDPTGANQLRGSFHQIQELKRQNPKLKVLISLGGWGQSGGFSSAAQPDRVREFVRSCVQTFIAGNFASDIQDAGIFDGIDLDWEYPVEGGVEPGHPEDKKNFTALVNEFRRQLDAFGPGLLLTAALPAEEEYYKNFELKEISKGLDFISIMAYDLHWNSEPITNFHSALFHDPADPSKPPLDKRFGNFAVQGFRNAGVPPEKIVFGVPFYGKGWRGVKDINHGLFQAAMGGENSIGSYRELKALSQAADRKYDPKVASCTIWYNGKFWSYDCPEALKQKLEYVKGRHLGGVMFWELSHDTPDSELLRTLAGGP